MKRIIMTCLCLALLSVLALFSMPVNPVYAGPAIHTMITVTQPDGTVLQVRIRGDEFQNWTELVPGGQTIVRNPTTNVWEYAERAPDGRLRPSGIKAEPGGHNAPSSTPNGLKPNPNQELQERMVEKLDPAQAKRDYERLSGDPPVLVVLVNFADRRLVTTPAGWYSKIFDTTAGAKSVTNFYTDNSDYSANLSPVQHSQPGNPPGIMTATVSDPHPDYDGNVSYADDVTIANHALAQIAPYIDFSSFDSNQSGTLEPTELGIYFIYAGYEASGSLKAPSVWAHSWAYPASITAGGLEAHYWGLNGELNNADRQQPIGVSVHQFGHLLFNLIDLYDANGVNQGMGVFSPMAHGAWGFDIGEDPGTTPARLDLWSRYHNSWGPYIPFPNGRGHKYLTAYSDGGDAGILAMAWFDDFLEFPPAEYFLIENRHPLRGDASDFFVDWDKGLWGFFGANWLGGLLIQHIDENIPGNQYVEGSHQRVVPVQASTAYCDMLAAGSTCTGHPTTLFYQGNNKEWGPDTAPSSNLYDGSQPGFRLTNISGPKRVMEADYDPDSIPPVITAFAVPGAWNSLTVPITTLTGTDNQKRVWYRLTETATPPTTKHYEGGWTRGTVLSHTFTSPGAKTLYAWAQDEWFTVSLHAKSATVTIDLTPPTVTSFTIPATSTSLSIPITFTATDDLGVTGYLVNESATKPLATDPGWSATRPTSYFFATTGTKTLYAWVKDAAGNVSDSRSAKVTITQVLPAPWSSRDVGSTGVAGSASYANGAFTLRGSGANISGTADAFHFVYKIMAGNFELVARVASLQNTNAWAKGGVMVRQSLDADSKNALMSVTPQSGLQFSYRTATGGTTAAISRSGMAPHWVKLVRQESTITAYTSSDGTNWLKVNSATVEMSNQVYVGMAVTSHNNALLCTGTLDRVATVALLPTPWESRDVGSTGIPGSAGYANGVFTLKGSGANISGTADAFRFAYKAMAGDFQIVARVASLQNTNGWAKAGVMIRQSLDPNSMNALMAVTPQNGLQFSYRTTTGGTTAAISRGGLAPYWVKLVRQGSAITAYMSSDAATWLKVNSATINMTGQLYVGMGVTSHNNSVLCTAAMEGVATSLPDVTPPTVTDFTIPSTSSSFTVPIVTFSATDNIGVAGYLLGESGTKPSPADSRWSTIKPESYTFTTEGDKTLYSWVKDAADNVSNSRSASVTITLRRDLLVGSHYTSQVLRYDGATGAFLDAFATLQTGQYPLNMVFGPDGNLYVLVEEARSVEPYEIYYVARFDRNTGAFMGFFTGSVPSYLKDLTFGPDGNLYISDMLNDKVNRYDGRTGAYIDDFVRTGSGGLRSPRGLVFGPDGNMYVSSGDANEVLRYDGRSGEFLGTFASGIMAPGDLLFGLDGNLYVEDLNRILRFDGITGALKDVFVQEVDATFDTALAFGPGGDLYVTTGDSGNSVLRFSGTTGELVHEFVSRGSGGLWGASGLVFYVVVPAAAGTGANVR